MAVKQYGYYIKGNSLAVVEKDTAFDNDVNSKDYGPGSEHAQWKSPIADSTSGIQLQYVCSPDHVLSGNANVLGKTKLIISGWFIDNNNFVCFVTYSATLTGNLEPTNGLPYLSAGVDEHIYIENSNKGI